MLVRVTNRGRGTLFHCSARESACSVYSVCSAAHGARAQRSSLVHTQGPRQRKAKPTGSDLGIFSYFWHALGVASIASPKVTSFTLLAPRENLGGLVALGLEEEENRRVSRRDEANRPLEFARGLQILTKPAMPAYLQSFSSDSMRSRALYLATRSLRQGAPVLMMPVARPTVRSAMVTSSVSPLRCEHMTDQLSLCES